MLLNHPSLLISCCIQGPKSAVAMLTTETMRLGGQSPAR